MDCSRNLFVGYANILLRTSNTQQPRAYLAPRFWSLKPFSAMSYQDSVRAGFQRQGKNKMWRCSETKAGNMKAEKPARGHPAGQFGDSWNIKKKNESEL